MFFLAVCTEVSVFPTATHVTAENNAAVSRQTDFRATEAADISAVMRHLLHRAASWRIYNDAVEHAFNGTP